MSNSTTVLSTQSKLRVLCIYHKNCWDGLASAWVVRKHFTDTIGFAGVPYQLDFHAAQYGDNSVHLDLISQYDRIFIVDFSFEPVVLNHWCDLYPEKHFVVIDHHKTFVDAWTVFCVERKEAGFQKEIQNLDIYLARDNNNSGAGLCWNFFFGGYTISTPDIIKCIEDRDLWKFQIPQSRAVHAWLTAHPMEFETLDSAIGAGLYIIHAEGVVIQDYQDELHRQLAEQLARPMAIMEHLGLCANVPGHFASEVGNLLAISSGTYGATYYTDKEGNTIFSLRSTAESCVDVSAIAALFGGGGHKNAAGFKLENPSPTKDPGVHLWQ